VKAAHCLQEDKNFSYSYTKRALFFSFPSNFPISSPKAVNFISLLVLLNFFFDTNEKYFPKYGFDEK
jgi:hypothetical protein